MRRRHWLPYTASRARNQAWCETTGTCLGSRAVACQECWAEMPAGLQSRPWVQRLEPLGLCRHGSSSRGMIEYQTDQNTARGGDRTRSLCPPYIQVHSFSTLLQPQRRRGRRAGFALSLHGPVLRQVAVLTCFILPAGVHTGDRVRWHK